MFYKKDQLKALLPALQDISPEDSDSSLRLLSLARIYTSLYRLVTVSSLDEELGNRREYTRKANKLFQVICKKVKQTKDLTERAHLVATLFSLNSETTLTYNAKREDACYSAAIRLMQDYQKSGEIEKANEHLKNGLCRCLTDFFYPKTEEDETDEWFIFLKETIQNWAQTISLNGNWEDTTDDIALERIEIMNRNSSMLLDSQYDSTIQKAYKYYNTHTPLTHMHTTARKAATTMHNQNQSSPVESDNRLFCISYVIDSLCEDIMSDIQQEMLQHIA